MADEQLAVALTADLEPLLKRLDEGLAAIDQWSKKANTQATVTPMVDTARLNAELAGVSGNISRQLARALDISPQVANMISGASRTEQAWLPTVNNIGNALKSLKFAQAASEAKSFALSISQAADSLSLLTKGLLIAGAAYAGWKIGRWISDITGLTDKVNDAGHYFNVLSDAEVAAGRAHIELKYGIDMTADAYRVFMSLTAEQRYNLLQSAQAAGTLKIGLDELAASVKALNDAAREETFKKMLMSEEKTFKDYIDFYSKSRMSQISIELAQVRYELAISAAGEKRTKLLEKENQLLKQKAQEYIRIKNAEEKTNSSVSIRGDDAERRAIANEQAALKAQEAWRNAHEQMTLDSQQGEQRELAILEKKVAEYKQALYAMTASAKEIADKIIEITQYEEQQKAAIKEKYREEEIRKQQEAMRKQQEDMQRIYNEHKNALQNYVHTQLDPISALVENAYNALNAKAALFAEQFKNIMAPLQSAFQSLLTGMKVKWGDVLKQMVAQFVMVFVNKFIAFVGSMLMQWISGETAKTAATATGAAARTAIVATEAAATTSLTAASLQLAIAEIFAAHAGIPFAGVGIAEGFIAEMMAMYAAFSALSKTLVAAGQIPAMAEGGLITQPTLALIGEAGEEVVAPRQAFVDVVRDVIVDARKGVDTDKGAAISFHTHLHGPMLLDSGHNYLLTSTVRKINQIQKSMAKKEFK